MNVIDLNDDYEKLYLVCLEDWSDDFKDAGEYKENWYRKMKEKGLRVKLALNDENDVGGMIQYLPIEYSIVEGKDLYFINCIWVHGHKKGRGNFQKKGMGKALLQAAEEDVKKIGKKGIVAWGISLPFWMKASWYKKQGYKVIDKIGIRVLLWKSFDTEAIPPKLIRQKKKPSLTNNKLTVTCFNNGWCQVNNINAERAKRICNEYQDKIDFKFVDTFEKETIKEWGISDALFVDGKEIATGPPLTYKKMKKKIIKKLK